VPTAHCPGSGVRDFSGPLLPGFAVDTFCESGPPHSGPPFDDGTPHCHSLTLARPEELGQPRVEQCCRIGQGWPSAESGTAAAQPGRRLVIGHSWPTTPVNNWAALGPKLARLEFPWPTELVRAGSPFRMNWAGWPLPSCLCRALARRMNRQCGPEPLCVQARSQDYHLHQVGPARGVACSSAIQGGAQGRRCFRRPGPAARRRPARPRPGRWSGDRDTARSRRPRSARAAWR
jgi:hypothetical protein